MAKRKPVRRYHIEIKHAKLSQTQSEYATELMQRKLLARDEDDFFVYDAENDDKSIHYIFRSEKLGKEIAEYLDLESQKCLLNHDVWRYRRWVEAPDRRMTGLFEDEGIVAVIRPGDDFKGVMYHQTGGEVVHGWFDNGNYDVVPELGEITRLWFQGRSTEVYRARRRFRYELHNFGQKTYKDLGHALEKASEQLGEHASIGIVNTQGDHYVITNRGVSPSPFMSQYEWGDAWIFEYKMAKTGITHADVYYEQEHESNFKLSLKLANVKQAIRRKGFKV